MLCSFVNTQLSFVKSGILTERRILHSAILNNRVTCYDRPNQINSKFLRTTKNPRKTKPNVKTTFFIVTKLRSITGDVYKTCASWFTINYTDKNRFKGPLEAREICSQLTQDILSAYQTNLKTYFSTNKNTYWVQKWNVARLNYLFHSSKLSWITEIGVKMFLMSSVNLITRRLLKYFFQDSTQTQSSSETENGSNFTDYFTDFLNKALLNEDISIFLAQQIIRYMAVGFEGILFYTLLDLATNQVLQDEVREVTNNFSDTGILDLSSLVLPVLEVLILNNIRRYLKQSSTNNEVNEDFNNSSMENETYTPTPYKFDSTIIPSQPGVTKVQDEVKDNKMMEDVMMLAVKVAVAQVLLKYKVVPCEEPQQLGKTSTNAVANIPNNNSFRFTKL